MTNLQPLLGLLACFSVFAVFIVILAKLEVAKNKARREKEKERQKTGQFNFKSEWARVPGGMERIEVDGGWIYRDYIGGHSITLCFVPFPKKTKKLKGL